jgi:hypothetical protein
MFPSKSNIETVCAALTEQGDKTSADALALIQEMEKILIELASVAPSFPDLIKQFHQFLNDHRKPGEEPLGKLDIVVAATPDSDELVPYDQVPAYSKPYLEILRLYTSLRRQRGTLS